MSQAESTAQQHAEAFRAFTEAFNSGDPEALVAACDPGIELRSSFAAIGGATFEGHDGLRRWLQDLHDEWGDQLRSETEALFDCGEDLLVYTILYGRGHESGVEVGLPAALIVRSRDGRVVRFRGYAHREDALSDLGLAEDALVLVPPA